MQKFVNPLVETFGTGILVVGHFSQFIQSLGLSPQFLAFFPANRRLKISLRTEGALQKCARLAVHQIAAAFLAGADCSHRLIQRTTDGHAIDMQKAGPCAPVEGDQQLLPEVLLKALADQWRAEKTIVMHPVLDMRHRPAPEPVGWTERQQTQQSGLSGLIFPQQEQTQLRVKLEMGEAGTQEPWLMENIRFARLPGKVAPRLDQIGIDFGNRQEYRLRSGCRQALAEPVGPDILAFQLL